MIFRRVILLLLISLAACHATQESRYYTLSAAFPATASPAPMNWKLTDVALPDIGDRPQIILRSGPNRVRILEYDRWAEPLDSMTRRILKEDLTARLRLNASPSKNTARIAVNIEEFDAYETGNVTLQALWTVENGRTKARTGYRFQKNRKANASDIGSSVSVMSQLLADLADAIAGRFIIK